MSEPVKQQQRAPISFDSKPANEDQMALMAELRAAFYGVTTVFDKIAGSRFKSLAETNLEQAAMWASKAVTHGPAANE
jgi:hypothetical protein